MRVEFLKFTWPITLKTKSEWFSQSFPGVKILALSIFLIRNFLEGNPVTAPFHYHRPYWMCEIPPYSTFYKLEELDRMHHKAPFSGESSQTLLSSHQAWQSEISFELRMLWRHQRIYYLLWKMWKRTLIWRQGSLNKEQRQKGLAEVFFNV